MTRWKTLPSDLEPEVVHLVQELRSLKDVTELTLIALASQTAYSKSAWERYLNGKKFPPRQAVLAMAEVAGPEHVAPLLELWRRAAHAQARGGGREKTQTAEVTGATEPPSRDRRLSRWHLIFGAASAALLMCVVLLVVAVTHAGNEDLGSKKSDGAKPAAGPSGLATPKSTSLAECRHKTCEGKDPRLAGCGDDARTAASIWLSNTLIELRYSSRCQAAWGRILQAKVGDQVHVDGIDGAPQTGRVSFGVDAFSPMTPAADPSRARACATLTSRAGKQATCTPQGSTAVASPSSSSGG
ncbi:helix-turn-helix domain-containing protein [Streptomyces bluensis]|uniref:helix-turn-helix domain-containing protein n=1 Tax=Streptomyces bluensis TaxID=33897 RepID=UPI0016734C39|nr:hypothetical protein GCM10010344_53940 [Streptomyces bluensis]